MINKELLDFFEKRNKEASWCYGCARRNTCKNKKAVSFEERLANEYVLKFVKVKAECLGYIKDSSVKVDLQRNFFKGLFY